MWVFNAAMAGYFVVNGEPGVSEPARAAAAASRPRRRDPLSALSAREREVLALMAGRPEASALNGDHRLGAVAGRGARVV